MSAFQPSAFLAAGFYSGVAGPSTYTFSPAGGITASGTGAVYVSRAPVISGGATLGGTSPRSRVRIPQVSGGIAVAGIAFCAKQGVGALTLIGGGGLSCTGSATVSKTKGYTSTTGAALSGTATWLSKIRVVPVSGGLSLSGSAAARRDRVYLSAGGTHFGGSSSTTLLSPTAARLHLPEVSGSFTLAGAAALQRTLIHKYVAAGGLSSSGQCWFDYVTAARRNTVQVLYEKRTLDVQSVLRELSVRGESRVLYAAQ